MNSRGLSLIWSSIKGVFRVHPDGRVESLTGHVSFGSPEGDRARTLIPGPNYPTEAELRVAVRRTQIKSVGARW